MDKPVSCTWILKDPKKNGNIKKFMPLGIQSWRHKRKTEYIVILKFLIVKNENVLLFINSRVLTLMNMSPIFKYCKPATVVKVHE